MITVLGLGFVGLTTALGFSKKGFTVYGIDVNEDRVASLQSGKVPFYEPHLADVLREELNQHFFLHVSLPEAIKNSKLIFICVGTPGHSDGSADLSYLNQAVKNVIENSNGDFKVIITKSTVPPSTVSKKVKPFVEELCLQYHQHIGLASNPEFLREGYAWEDFMNPDRIVIGVEDEKSKDLIQHIYSPFDAPMHFVSFNSAEFIKYLSNTLLSTLISYSNEMAMIAEHIGDIDIPTSFKILHQDKRWSGHPASMTSYVYPGCGYGGYCLPKDTAALKSIAQEYGFVPQMLEANLGTNETIKKYVAEKVMSQVSKDKVIGILGLAFKSGSDDVRFSPSKFITEYFLEKGYSNIIAYDPEANHGFHQAYALPIDYSPTLAGIVKKADALVLLTGWPEFKQQKKLIQTKPLFDCRYLLS